jgi:hypothetical protein
MSVAVGFEAAAGILLVFFVPGYAVTKALFPEWRVRGPLAVRRGIEIGTLSFVLSLVLTVLAGYVLLVAAPAGFQAYWSSPVLEAVLFGIALAAFVAAYARGAFARQPPAPRPLEPSGGEEGAWQLTRQLDELGRQERRLEHQIRVADPADGPRLRGELDSVRAQSAALRASREAEYAR